jgi:hypothetical protein
MFTGDQMQAVCSAAPCAMLTTANIKINWIYKLCGVQHCRGFGPSGFLWRVASLLIPDLFTNVPPWYAIVRENDKNAFFYDTLIGENEVCTFFLQVRKKINKSATQHNNPEHPNAQHQRCKNLILQMTLIHWVRSSHCIKLKAFIFRVILLGTVWPCRWRHYDPATHLQLLAPKRVPCPGVL